MKNNLIKFFLYIFLSLTLTLQSSSNEVINLNVTLIEISENGNVLKGYDGGEAFTNDGISITAENFEYNKILAHLIANENVEYKDKVKNITIISNKISYLKDKEEVEATGEV